MNWGSIPPHSQDTAEKPVASRITAMDIHFVEHGYKNASFLNHGLHHKFDFTRELRYREVCDSIGACFESLCKWVIGFATPSRTAATRSNCAQMYVPAPVAQRLVDTP